MSILSRGRGESDEMWCGVMTVKVWTCSYQFMVGAFELRILFHDIAHVYHHCSCTTPHERMWRSTLMKVRSMIASRRLSAHKNDLFVRGYLAIPPTIVAKRRASIARRSVGTLTARWNLLNLYPYHSDTIISKCAPLVLRPSDLACGLSNGVYG